MCDYTSTAPIHGQTRQENIDQLRPPLSRAKLPRVLPICASLKRSPKGNPITGPQYPRNPLGNSPQGFRARSTTPNHLRRTFTGWQLTLATTVCQQSPLVDASQRGNQLIWSASQHGVNGKKAATLYRNERDQAGFRYNCRNKRSFPPVIA